MPYIGKYITNNYDRILNTVENVKNKKLNKKF